jgi:hypothetical protein
MPVANGAELTPTDRAVTDLLRRSVPALRDAAVLKRLPVDNNLDLVLAIGWPWKVELFANGEVPWSPQDRIGLFLQDRTDSGRLFRLAVEPGPMQDSFLRVERMTAGELVLSCVGEKWSTYDNQKFLIDIHARSVVKHFSYAPFRVNRVLQSPRGPRFVMTDQKRSLLIESDSETGVPRVVSAFQPPATPSAPVTWFGPGKRFRLSQEKNTYGSDFPVIIERRGQQEKSFLLPQSDLETWREARPDDAESGIAPNAAEMNEQIGPHQLEGDRLWFGKSFYNSEGLTGVGGFGYFDAAARSWKIYSPPEIQRWSVSAILVEPDAIWLALHRRGEYGNSSGGLLRWDRRTEQVEVLDRKLSADHIARCGDALCMGADGFLVLKDQQLRSYFLDQTSDGRYQMALRE